jgi:hypothetical protein
MGAVALISIWITWLTIIFEAGACTMVAYFALRKSLSTEMQDISHYNNKIKQTIKGAIVGLTIGGVVTIAQSYFM